LKAVFRKAKICGISSPCESGAIAITAASAAMSIVMKTYFSHQRSWRVPITT
jgi:hypothetical protein